MIGAGGAGLRAAIAAKDEGISVAVVSKSLPGKAHTVMAEGGIAAALGNMDPNDNWQVHFKDTLKDLVTDMSGLYKTQKLKLGSAIVL